MIISAADLRGYMGLDPTSADSRYSDATLGSNIRAATAYLERRTGRIFADVTATLKFTTNGDAYVTLPGLRTATSISLSGATLTADSTYYLIADSQQEGLYSGIQFQPFGSRQGGAWWLSNPEWFDRNLDSPYHPANRGGGVGSLPNDLVITGAWGLATYPESWMHAVKVLAGYYTRRPDAFLSGAYQTPDGSAFDLSHLPIEVSDFVRDWRILPMVAAL